MNFKPSIQEVLQAASRININEIIPKHILLKLLKIKNKENFLKTAREKRDITLKRATITLTTDFLT